MSHRISKFDVNCTTNIYTIFIYITNQNKHIFYYLFIKKQAKKRLELQVLTLQPFSFVVQPKQINILCTYVCVTELSQSCSHQQTESPAAAELQKASSCPDRKTLPVESGGLISPMRFILAPYRYHR